MSYYCKKCDKVIPSDEVKILPAMSPDLAGTPWHIYTKLVDFYENAASSKKSSFDPVEEKTYCSKADVVEEFEIELTEEDFDEII